MRVVFGLGNPGKEYEETRHNVGFRVVDRLSQKYKVKLDSYLCQCWMGEGRIDEERILLAKPLTEEYVLGRFSSEERRIIEEAVDKATEAIEVMIKRGIDKAMREYN